MATVDDGVNRWNANHRFNRVSFDFHEHRNAKRSETIAKRSKTPLKKSNSLMVLRSTDMIAISAAPSIVDATSTDDVTSSSCSIDCSPVPTDSSSTGMGRRRRLPCLPSQDARQGINSAVVGAGGVRVTGLQRKHSMGWPSSSGTDNHRLIYGVNHHRSIDGVNHQPSIHHHRSINGVNHCGNNVLDSCLSNGISQHAHENINPSGKSVDRHMSDIVNHRTHNTATQSPTVASNRHINGVASNFVSIQQQSLNVDKSTSDVHNLNPAGDGFVGHHKSEFIIHLQGHSDRKLKDTGIRHIHGQSDIKLSGGSIDHGASEIKPGSVSHCVLRHHNHSINHLEGLVGNANASKDDTLRRGLANECQNEVTDKSQCTNGDFSDITSDRHKDCASTFQTGSPRSHDNGLQRDVDSSNQHEILSSYQRNKLNPHKNEGGIHSTRDKLNNYSNNGNVGNKPMPSLSVESDLRRQKYHQQKLHITTSLDENASPAAEREFQNFGRVLQRKASLDSKHGAQTKVANSGDIASMEEAIGSRAKQGRLSNVFRRQTIQLGSYFDATSSSLRDYEEVLEDDQKVVCKNINRSLKQEQKFQRQGRNSWKTENESLNYLISPSQEKPNDAHPSSECCHPLVDSPLTNSSTLSSSYRVTRTQDTRTVLTPNGTNSQLQNGIHNGKHFPFTRKNKAPDDIYQSSKMSETNWTSLDDSDFHPERSSTLIRRATPTVPPCVPTLHTLLQTYRMTAVSLLKSTPVDDCGLKLTSVPFMANAGTSRHPARFSPKGKRATKLGSPDGAFRPVATVETSPGRDGQPQVVMVTSVEDGSVAAAGGSIEEGDVVLEVNGTYVLGSKLDAIERLLTVDQQHLNLVLAKPIGTTDPTHVNGCLNTTNDFNGRPIPQRTILHRQDELSPVTSDQRHSTLEHAYLNGDSSSETSIDRRLKTIAVRPTKLGCSSKWSSESEYTIRPIEADSAIRTKTTGFSESDEAYYPSSDSYDEEIPDHDYRWQKISAV